MTRVRRTSRAPPGRLCDHVPDTGPEKRRWAGDEDGRRVSGVPFREQERFVLRQSVPGRLGARLCVGERRGCAGATGSTGGGDPGQHERRLLVRTLRRAHLQRVRDLEPGRTRGSGQNHSHSPTSPARFHGAGWSFSRGNTLLLRGGHWPGRSAWADHENLDLRLHGHKAVSTAAAALALLAKCSPVERGPDILKERAGESPSTIRVPGSHGIRAKFRPPTVRGRISSGIASPRGPYGIDDQRYPRSYSLACPGSLEGWSR